MYIDEIAKIEGCKIKLSSFEPNTKRTLDFNVVQKRDPQILKKVGNFLAQKNLFHFIVIENVVHKNKTVDFSSRAIENTLYMAQPDGKVYRWSKVGVAVIRIGEERLTCIVSNHIAKPYNQRDTFRISVDCYGTVLFSGAEKPEACMVRDVSHEGIGIQMKETKTHLGKGLPAEISWEETAHFDDSGKMTTRKYTVNAELVRAKKNLDGQMVLGFQQTEETDPIREYIQWAQRSKGIAKEAEASTVKSGVTRAENWETKKELEKMGGVIDV